MKKIVFVVPVVIGLIAFVNFSQTAQAQREAGEMELIIAQVKKIAAPLQEGIPMARPSATPCLLHVTQKVDNGALTDETLKALKVPQTNN